MLTSPSPLNPLGVKGVGECGVIPAAAAIISAVEDALKPFGVRIEELRSAPRLSCRGSMQPKPAAGCTNPHLT